MLPHYFIGPNPNSRVHDIGSNVTTFIVGDIDGRLWSGLNAANPSASDPLNPNLFISDVPIPAVNIGAEGGLLISDRHGTMVNEQFWTQPQILLPGWFDSTIWQDLGLTSPKISYALKNKVLPKFQQKETWRDLWLEYAIQN